MNRGIVGKTISAIGEGAKIIATEILAKGRINGIAVSGGGNHRSHIGRGFYPIAARPHLGNLTICNDTALGEGDGYTVDTEGRRSVLDLKILFGNFLSIRCQSPNIPTTGIHTGEDITAVPINGRYDGFAVGSTGYPGQFCHQFVRNSQCIVIITHVRIIVILTVTCDISGENITKKRLRIGHTHMVDHLCKIGCIGIAVLCTIIKKCHMHIYMVIVLVLRSRF